MALGIELTPLIDIVFLLLIFFMLTSSFVFQPGLKIHLPKAVTAEVAGKEHSVVSVTRGDLLYLGGSVVTLQELRSKLARVAGSQQPVLLRADRGASMGRVVEVWDLCRGLGISRVHLAADTNDTNER